MGTVFCAYSELMEWGSETTRHISMKQNTTKLFIVALALLLFMPGSLPAGTVSYQYDALHRLTSVDYGNGTTIAYTYDPAGNILTTVKISEVDSDGDGLTDQDEINIYGTNPTLYDTDGDGLGDGIEVGVVELDADPTTTTDPLNPDSDGDGYLDGNNGVDPCEDCNNNGQVDLGESSPIAPEAFIHLVQGWNLFAYPSAVPIESSTCLGLAEALGGFGLIESIARLNTTIGLFERCDATGVVDYPIVSGEAYIVEATANNDLVWSWSAVCPSLEFDAGVNLVGHPATPSDLTCFAWLEAQTLGLVATIQRFNSVTRRFEYCVLADPDGTGAQPAGMDFPIRAGQGYIFHTTGSGTLILPGCP